MSAASFSRSIAPLLLCCVLLVSCAYPQRNVQAQSIGPNVGYQWSEENVLKSKTLVVVTISGGGTRAAALGLSVLDGLQRVKIGGGKTLADRIDIISSVSGGSVTAALFALSGFDGLAALRPNFLERDGIGTILANALNPIGLARLSTEKTERIDLLIDYFDSTLYHKRKFADVIARKGAPLLLLNAADMVSEAPFSFTQNNFDLICSDLSDMKLSTAVAASAAFPVALSAVTLQDYSPCAAQGDRWPPAYVENGADVEWSTDPERASLGRLRMQYAQGTASKPPTAFIHLLDGGIADNLGVAEPIDLLTRNSPYPGLLNQFAEGNIQNIVFVMINARSFSTSHLDQRQETPSIGDMLSATINGSLDNATVGGASRLRNVLLENFSRQADILHAAGDLQGEQNLRQMRSHTHLVEVDFDAIKSSECRDAFHNISTSWTLPNSEIDALMLAGQAILFSSQQLPGALEAVGGHVEGQSPSIADACKAIGVN